jgi:predicted transposase/invertase (TIGR01784 family)
MRRYLDPKNDFAFKRLFGTEKNKRILIAFLNDIFEGAHDKIVDVTFLPPNLDPEIKCLRQSIVDVKCKDINGRQFIIEMQCAKEAHFIKRAVAYASNVYISQRKGKGYGDMNDVIFLAILDHTLFPCKSEYLSHHRVCDLLTHEVDIKELSFTFLELGKFHKRFDELRSNVEKWCYFFKEEASPDEIDEVKKRDRVLSEAYEALSKAAFTEEQLLEYEGYDMKDDEINTRIAEGEAKGLAEGLAEGELKGKRETAKAMKLSVEQIAKATGLTASEIERLKK